MRLPKGVILGSLVASGVACVAAFVINRRAERASGMRTARSARTGRLVGMSARTGADYMATRARSTFASEEKRAELAERFELRTAEQVAEQLGHMKGALMKLGQMASYLDQGLPEPVRQALAELQSDAPPMAAGLAEAVVTGELGVNPQELFAQWDPRPIASASIGQVHRAVTHDGTEVAVKVQYPGVADAITADLDNTELLFAMLGMLFPGMEPGPIVDELRERVLEELDYHLEADNQRLFADAYRGHPYIHVPEVLEDLSTSRVLTTEMAHGARFAEVTAWFDDERQLAAETLYRFVFGSIYSMGAFNGDPHPGNYLFRPGGQITFLDFGLVKRFNDREVADFAEMIQLMVLDHDVAGYARLLERIGILAADNRFSDQQIRDYFGHFYDFVMTDEEMEITPEYSSESLRRFFDLSGPHSEIMKTANLPPSMVIVQRINLGLYALFGDLRARNNWRRIAEELWPFVEATPATPMGERIAEWEESR